MTICTRFIWLRTGTGRGLFVNMVPNIQRSIKDLHFLINIANVSFSGKNVLIGSGTMTNFCELVAVIDL